MCSPSTPSSNGGSQHWCRFVIRWTPSSHLSRANEDDGLALVQRNTPSTLRDEMKLPFMEMIDNRRLASDLRAAERLYSDLLSLTSGAPEHHAIVSAQISQQPQSR
jgi:hypothetical protein